MTVQLRRLGRSDHLALQIVAHFAPAEVATVDLVDGRLKQTCPMVEQDGPEACLFSTIAEEVHIARKVKVDEAARP